MKTIEKWDLFVNAYFECDGNEETAYRKVYPRAKPENVRICVHQLLQKNYVCNKIAERKKQYQELSKQVAKKNEQLAVENTADQLTIELLTFSRKREILKEIAEGRARIKTGKFFSTGRKKGAKAARYEWIEYEEQPDFAARMKAIELDNQMIGDIAPSRLFAAVQDLNNPDESGHVERFVILSNGEKIPL